LFVKGDLKVVFAAFGGEEGGEGEGTSRSGKGRQPNTI
jgi:hypothetical protein